MRRPINVIITMAGKSKRFHEAGYTKPKAFLQVGHSKMIDHVISMFNDKDRFFFVVSEEQVRNYPKEIEYLKTVVKNSHIVKILCHDIGPIHSALQVKNISDNEEVIISYCDFTVRWDYERFLREVKGFDASIISFSGLHPASFGNTYYAYMRVEGNHLLELKEKASFTNNRHEEPASVGIYYFRDWKLFQKYGNNFLHKRRPKDPEAYISLLFNFMVKDDLEVLVFPVKNFICYGTPKDLTQYQFWFNFFHEKHDKKEPHPFNKQVNLIPMAGAGNRFSKVGYHVSKPFIQIRSKPMFIRASCSFPKANRWVFFINSNLMKRYPIKKTLQELSYNFDIIKVERLTKGQASTCLLGKDKIIRDRPLLIASCDYEIRYSSEEWRSILEDEKIDGAVWVSRLEKGIFKNPTAFAYCQINTDGQTIRNIVEKQTISDHPEQDPMVIGTFWYRKGEDFIWSAESMIEKNITVNNEYYVATSINQLIQKGKKIVIFDVTQWVSYGDPFELKIFEYWEDYFYHLQKDSR